MKKTTGYNGGAQENDGLFTCYTCRKILGYLSAEHGKAPRRIYLANRIEEKNGIYRCKHCGAVQWGYKREEGAE